MKNLTLLLTVFMLSGCASFVACLPGQTTPESRQKFITDHPDLPPDIKKYILDKRIYTGMTKDQVKASWGKPSEIHQTSDPNGTVDEWIYFQTSYLYFYGDKLSYWNQQT